jgi:multidrug efflux pump
MSRLQKEWSSKVKDAKVMIFQAPPIAGISVAGGFKLVVEDRGGLGLVNLQAQTDKIVAELQKFPSLKSAATPFRSNIPQLFMDIDRSKAASLGVSLDDLNQTLEIYLGSLYVNSFNKFGRHWQVTLQADGKYREQIANINLLEVRNKYGQMVPLGSLVRMREIGGPISVLRYNLYAAAPITGGLAPGVSSGEVIHDASRLAEEFLPRSMGSEWTELMFFQIRAGNTAIYVFALAVMCVFLALAALYESWALPLAVILVVPLCILCSVIGVIVTNGAINMFVQIGLVVLVGLACKNAILVVEFAQQMHAAGKARREATLEASRLRLRPILMTSFAFILGVVPLVVASGAGAEMRRSLGTAVFSGMIGVTLFGIFLTPVFFYVIQGFGDKPVFLNLRVRRAISGAVGGGLGLICGYLMAQLGIVPMPWAPLVGAAAGALTVLTVVGVQERIKWKGTGSN